MLDHLEVDEATAKKVRGRGQVTLKKSVPQISTKEVEENKIRSPMMRKAIACLKQARRCEQVSHRIIKGREESEDKKQKYRILNKEAIKGISKALDLGDKEDLAFGTKLEKYNTEEIKEEMMVPTIELQSKRYHKSYEKWRRQTIEAQRKEDQKNFKKKGKGQWNLMRSMEKRGQGKPLIALRRKVKGPRGQPKGSVTTNPDEVDSIIRAAYGKIYDGNAKEPAKLKEKYLEDYKKFIFESIEAEAEPITGKDLEEAMRGTKETAAGLDQWTPADLKLLSPKAYQAIAEMLNEIEKGKAWPRHMNIARAAFLPKEEMSSMEPLEYRVLLMLPGIYRMWAKTRLQHLAPWIKLWQLEGMYAGVEGKGAADAVYSTALRIELCNLLGEDFAGAAADIYKCFDQNQRPLMHGIPEKAGMPRGILRAYKHTQETMKV